jgi:hypothetical protein
MATWTQIVGAVENYRAYNGKHLFRPYLVVSRLLAAGAGDLVIVRLWHAQQPLHGQSPGAVHRIPHQHLDCLQVERARLMPTAEDNLHDTAYFLGNLLLDCFDRFLSCGESVSSTGRVRQICSFTSTKDLLNC